MVGQHDQVVAPLAQRRHRDRQHGQAVVQVLAERAAGDGLLQLDVRGGDHAQHAGRLVTHKQLLTTVWGPAHADDAHYLRIAIGHIREKIGDDASDPKFILTEPGVGYRLSSS